MNLNMGYLVVFHQLYVDPSNRCLKTPLFGNIVSLDLVFQKNHGLYHVHIIT